MKPSSFCGAVTRGRVLDKQPGFEILKTMSDPILDTLNIAQREAVTYAGRHLLVFAGPGTGKTRVITHRVVYLIKRQGIDPETILAITFTNKAASEMKGRLSVLLGDVPGHPWVGTFHAFAHWLLRRHSKDLKLPEGFVIYDADDQKALMREILAETEIGASKAGVLLDIIQRLKDDLMDAQSYSIHTDVASDPHRSQIAKIYLTYQQALINRGAVDFGDLLLYANHLLRDFPPILRCYQERFGSIFVDEYQDVNRSQYALVKLLVGAEGSLTCVADDDQVIYEWRNANPRYTLDFDKEFKGAGAVVLKENYRSTPEVIKAAVQLIRRNEVRKDKELAATRPAGVQPQVLTAEEETEEARLVARRIKELLTDGVNPREVAVFYRINAQSRNFEIELRSQGIPYKLIGAVGFYARREIKDILSFARVAVNPKDEVGFLRILTNFSVFSLTRDAIGRLKEIARRENTDLLGALKSAGAARSFEFSQKAAKKISRFLETYGILRARVSAAHSIARVIEGIVADSDYLKDLEEERAWNIQELIRATEEYEKQNPGAGLLEFLSHTSLLASAGADNNRQAEGDRVSLMTVHLAKGLEFAAVFLTGLEESLFPFKVSRDNPQDLEEERRLFYVGMTRAKDYLFLTRAERRALFGAETHRRPSRFLYEAGVLAGEWDFRPTLKRGARVKHPLYGEGRVVAVSGGDDDTKVTVTFMGGGTRKFLVKMAPLEVL
ncbi:MAG: UvrD-helicase domain-containing protein [Elusimicrobia bacterium]|nr:UvrD-helicase domain-containing protein [Elusimicrobiota bacterium]